MQDKLMSILEHHGTMALATLRPDGWPQATTVSYMNQGMTLYFLISRTSQKFANITADERVSIAIGSGSAAPTKIEGVSMAARAFELRDEPYRSQMLASLAGRHPGYFDPGALDMKASALIRAIPEIISIVDFSKGLGHAETITVGAEQIVNFTANRPDNWGENPV